jgi:hypothetical protein
MTHTKKKLFKGGSGHMYALDPQRGKVVWESYLMPQAEGDAPRGPVRKTPPVESTWANIPGIPVSGGGVITYTKWRAKGSRRGGLYHACLAAEDHGSESGHPRPRLIDAVLRGLANDDT